MFCEISPSQMDCFVVWCLQLHTILIHFVVYLLPTPPPPPSIPFLRTRDTATLVKNLSKMARNSTRITLATDALKSFELLHLW